MTDLPETARPSRARGKRLGARDAFDLVGPGNIWHVVDGMVDVFMIDAQAETGRRHVFRAEAGDLLFGALEPGDARMRLLAVPGNNTLIAAHAFGKKPAPAADVQAAGLTKWVRDLTNAMVPGLAPVDTRLVEGSQSFAATEPVTLVAADAPLWVLDAPPGATYLGAPLPSTSGAAARFCLTKQAFATLPAGATVTLLSVTDWATRGENLPEGLADFHAFALERIRALQSARSAADLAALAERDAARAAALGASVDQLGRRIEDREVVETEAMHPVLAACDLVARAIGVTLDAPAGGDEAIDATSHPVELIAEASRLKTRTVGLGEAWWRHESGPLVGQWTDGGYCALLWKETGHYRIVDPARGIDRKVTPEIAASLSKTAIQLCEPLPDGPIDKGTMLRFAGRGALVDIVVIIAMTLAVGALSLVPPLATEVVFSAVIPSNQFSMAVMIGVLVLVAGASLALFSLVQDMAVLRIEGRLDLRLQAALWDRLVRLPVTFFRQVSSGSLVGRTQMLNAVRKLLTGSLINSMVSGMTGLFSFALMVYYAPVLALVMAVLTSLISLAGLMLGRRMVALDRKVLTFDNAIQAKVVQLLSGLDKVRVSATEDVAFRRWARMLSDSQVFTNMSNRANVALLSLMNGMLAPLALAAVFITVGIQSGELFASFSVPDTWAKITGQPLESVMSTARFIAFFAAYVQFIFAVTDLMTVGIRLSAVPPLLEQIKPVFSTPTEHFGARDLPGEIVGGIEFRNVTFRYEEGGPPILDNLSLSIAPGEFVALVGPSGSGKSSLLRLLLGFETPQDGTVYLDGHNLAPLDKVAIRRQLGVVMQDARLIPGTILENMTGGATVARDAVWAAADHAGLTADLQKMSKGLDTMVNDGATNLSGGQRQRIFIARALLRKPRLLILDEATSALDNETQEIVSRTVESMNVTRIAVAHRLSTILKADRIHVIVAGKLAESGTYQQLMDQKGVFADLVAGKIH